MVSENRVWKIIRMNLASIGQATLARDHVMAQEKGPGGPNKGPSSLENGPRGQRKQPKRLKKGPKRPNDGPKRPKHGPKKAKTGPRTPKEVPGGTQEGHRRGQDRPKRAARRGRDRPGAETWTDFSENLPGWPRNLFQNGPGKGSGAHPGAFQADFWAVGRSLGGQEGSKTGPRPPGSRNMQKTVGFYTILGPPRRARDAPPGPGGPGGGAPVRRRGRP